MNGTPSWRASASPIWSSERYPFSISTRPSFRPERPWSSRAALSCSCEMSFCCTSRSPSRTRSGRLVLMGSAMIFRSRQRQGDVRLSSRAKLPCSRPRRKHLSGSALAQSPARQAQQPGKQGGPITRQFFQRGQPLPRPVRVHPYCRPERAHGLGLSPGKREQRDLAQNHRGHRVGPHHLGIERELVPEIVLVESDRFARDAFEVRPEERVLAKLHEALEIALPGNFPARALRLDRQIPALECAVIGPHAACSQDPGKDDGENESSAESGWFNDYTAGRCYPEEQREHPQKIRVPERKFDHAVQSDDRENADRPAALRMEISPWRPPKPGCERCCDAQQSCDTGLGQQLQEQIMAVTVETWGKG